jgi:hypothetical protein
LFKAEDMDAYAAGSWRKPKSLDGMSSMPRDAPWCGDRARDGLRAGDGTRAGSVDGERLGGVVAADSGLHGGVSSLGYETAGRTMRPGAMMA